MSNKTTSTTTPSSGSGKVHSAQADSDNVKTVVQTETQSMISIENTKKITNCMPHFGPTHLQGDEYSHKLTEEVRDAISESIKIVDGETQLQEQRLLADASLQIQNDFKRKLPQRIMKLDSEKEIDIRQERILKSAHKCFNDDLYEDNSLKLTCMDDYMADDIDVIADLDDGENHETIFRRYVVVVPISTAEPTPVAELASTAEPTPVAELASTAEPAPAALPFSVEPRCNRHYFTCGIIIGLLVGIIIMKVVK